MDAKLAPTGGLRRAATAAAVCGVGALLAFCAPAAEGSYEGTLDPAFGHGGGTVAESVPGSAEFGDSLALMPDGRIVVGAYAGAEPHNGNAPSTAVVVRLLPNGRLDPGFGRGGYVVLSGVGGFAPSPVPFDERSSITPVRVKVLLTGDGRILVLGSSLVRLDSHGSLDPTLGSSGTARLPSGFTAAGMALAPDGSIAVVGDEQLPAGCTDSAQRALSFPVVLLSCETHDVLVDVTDRQMRPLPSSVGEHDWGNIDRVWVGPTRAASCPNFHVCEEYLDWHTGAVRRIVTPPAPSPPANAPNEPVAPSLHAEVLARNLDSADLTPVAACPPFQPTNFGQSLVAYPRLYEPPYLLHSRKHIVDLSLCVVAASTSFTW